SVPIYCNDEIVCEPIDSNGPLLPARKAIAFRAKLLFSAWEADACDGRQMAIDDLDRIDKFETSLSMARLSENELLEITRKLGDFIPVFLSQGRIEVPERALLWAQDGGDAA
ncbi:MAG: hypothetical protein CMJ57_02745, partial [Planctomycetaceae bacterium]|nr:hypothetical protein [Planctomycetaceae bacterium]